MDWLNINRKTLSSDEAMASDFPTRATWVWLLGYCVWQENGGRIPKCRSWPMEFWMMKAGVTLGLDKLHENTGLWTWDGEDLMVKFYPVDAENVLRQKRQAGQAGGLKRGDNHRLKHTDNGASSTPEKVLERKEIEKEEKEKGEEKRNGTAPRFAEVPSFAEVNAYALAWPGEPASGAPVMDGQWVVAWFARINGRPGGWMPDWRAAIESDWRRDFRKVMAGGVLKNEKPKSVLDLKTQLTLIEDMIRKSPANETGDFFDSEHTMADEETFDKLVKDAANLKKQIVAA